jgi:hypothetical protein
MEGDTYEYQIVNFHYNHHKPRQSKKMINPTCKQSGWTSKIF